MDKRGEIANKGIKKVPAIKQARGIPPLHTFEKDNGYGRQ
jgi:hypothetical protein